MHVNAVASAGFAFPGPFVQVHGGGMIFLAHRSSAFDGQGGSSLFLIVFYLFYPFLSDQVSDLSRSIDIDHFQLIYTSKNY